MIVEMIQASGSRISQLEVLPGNPTTSRRRHSPDNILGSSVPAGDCTSGRRRDQTKLEHLTRELKEISTLYNLSVTVGSSLNLEQVIWLLYKESSQLLDTSNFSIITYEAEADTLNLALTFEEGRSCQPRSLKRADSPEVISRVLTERRPLLTHAPPNEESLRVTPIYPKRQVRSWLAVPIFNPMLPDEGVQGVIATWSYEPNAFSDHKLWLLSAIGAQAAITIRNARLYEAVLAERDRVVEAQQEACHALARDLHDGPTQLVSAVSMGLDFCQQLLKKDPARLGKEIEAIQELARQATHQMRTLLFELRPLALETQGLQSAVQLFLERRQKEIGGRTKLTLKVKTDKPGGEISRQETKVEATLFAIIQETVNNALKHAQANQIVVQFIETATLLSTIIADDGVGFNLEQVMSGYEQQGSLGMINIRERTELIGGELNVQSKSGQGVRFIIQVPKAEADRLKKRGATGPLRLRRKKETD
jgi:signal transduction histidine kinase